MTSSITITFSREGMRPPVFITSSLVQWQIWKMDIRDETTENGDQIFYKTFEDVKDGEYQYKFRLGYDDWWVLDSEKETVTDNAGNVNNVIFVQAKNEQPSDSEDSEEETVEEHKGTADQSGAPKSLADDFTSNGTGSFQITPTSDGSTTSDSTKSENKGIVEDKGVTEDVKHAEKKASVEEVKEDEKPSSIPIPITVVEKVPDVEPPIYSGVEPRSLETNGSKRAQDAEPDAEYVIVSDAPAENTEENGDGKEKNNVEKAKEDSKFFNPPIPIAVFVESTGIEEPAKARASEDQSTSTENTVPDAEDVTKADISKETIKEKEEEKETKEGEAASSVPVPFTVVEKVPDADAPVYGDVEPKTLKEDAVKRAHDAEPDAEYITTPEAPAEEVASPDNATVPRLVLEKEDDEPSHGDDFGREATSGQKVAHEMRAADALPDETIISPTADQISQPIEVVENPEPTPESERSPLLSHEVLNSTENEPSPLLPHEKLDRSHESAVNELAPLHTREQTDTPLDSTEEEPAHLLPHENEDAPVEKFEEPVSEKAVSSNGNHKPHPHHENLDAIDPKHSFPFPINKLFLLSIFIGVVAYFLIPAFVRTA
ncbi:uncharacterized protein BDZ99DRAFT_503196 [Mytilinidion resinicola]|uniref:AMP-activated protein kinase glycogen-binding domain-containing protein n=1 Tax=Mytilinidion resinicola TaxID=574789 RepID=A0A6A6Y4N0_9PEZI|nr:uncharacterized protein BDZ99DRAFT_503196 [Mytilinidion resinicola]KAF2803589.1 hypothetical protein BDZ99DRAFT_503196 [Mytilinidion resinicola]